VGRAAFVCTDGPPGDAPTIMPRVDAVTNSGLAYLRMHGRNAEGYLKGTSVAERFDWDYAGHELEGLAERARGLAQDAGEVRMMFNNNRDDLAPQAATRMRMLLGQDPSPPLTRSRFMPPEIRSFPGPSGWSRDRWPRRLSSTIARAAVGIGRARGTARPLEGPGAWA
jgi:hypothetical protein